MELKSYAKTKCIPNITLHNPSPFKAIFQGQSIAKRVLGFRVFNNKTGQPAAPLDAWSGTYHFAVAL